MSHIPNSPSDNGDRRARLRDKVQVIISTNRNTIIMMQNLEKGPDGALRLLLKEVPGHGLSLAQVLYGHIPHLQHLLVPPAPGQLEPPELGTRPPGFDPEPRIDAFQLADFVKLTHIL